MPLDNYIINRIDEVYQFNLFPILYGLVYNVIFRKRIDMLELARKIRMYTEAGIILNHMYLFDELEKLIKKEVKCKI